MKIAVLITLLSLYSFAQVGRHEVRVSEVNTVRVGDPIRLGTLINHQIDDAEISAKIYNLVVLEPFTSEGEKVFQSEELALALRKKLSFQDLQRVAVKIPETFKIKARRNYLYPSDISREIKEKALALCRDCQIEFDDLRIPDMNTKEEILQVRLETQNLKSAGSFLLPLQVETSKTRNVFWITGRLSFYKEAPVAKRMILSNERIAASDFEIKRVNVSYAKDGIPNLQDLAGKISARNLSVGQPIFMADLKKEPAAVRGQTMKVLVGSDNFEVASTGTAEESGSVGDMIRVKSHDSQKVLSGVLVDKGTVRIQ